MKFKKKISRFTFLLMVSLILFESIQASRLKVKLRKGKNDKEKNKDKDNDDNNKDPFASLGVEMLDPKKLLSELENETTPKSLVKSLSNIQDLPDFVKNSSLSDDEVMDVISRFLLQDDINLRQYGAVYDKTGFDEVKEVKELPDDPMQAALIQAKSAAIIYVKEKLNNPTAIFGGIEQVFQENIPNWIVLRALFNPNSPFVLKICLPLDSSLVPMCSLKDEPCYLKATAAEKAKMNNSNYLDQLRNHYIYNRPYARKSKKKGVLVNNNPLNNYSSANLQIQDQINMNPQVAGVSNQNMNMAANSPNSSMNPFNNNNNIPNSFAFKQTDSSQISTNNDYNILSKMSQSDLINLVLQLQEKLKSVSHPQQVNTQVQPPQIQTSPSTQIFNPNQQMLLQQPQSFSANTSSQSFLSNNYNTNTMPNYQNPNFNTAGTPQSVTPFKDFYNSLQFQNQQNQITPQQSKFFS